MPGGSAEENNMKASTENGKNSDKTGPAAAADGIAATDSTATTDEQDVFKQEDELNNRNEQQSDSAGNDSKKGGSFRRAKSRASRACEICHARKVRCDVMVHMPCTNCAAFGCECRIPEVRQRKGTKMNKTKSSGTRSASSSSSSAAKSATKDKVSAVNVIPPEAAGAQNKEGALAAAEAAHDAQSMAWKRMLDTRVQQPGRVSFMGSTSHLNLILENMPDSEAYYFAAVGESSLGLSRIKQMDREDIDVLKLRGAFLLPAQELCDDLIECYFEKVHPLVPIVNRAQFMRQYNDPNNPPSLLLRQAILVAASRACTNPALLDEKGSSKLATDTFYKRAKALFDANYEMDRISVIQTAILLAWYLEGPDDVTANGFYWTRIGISVAQGIGLHRNMEKSGIPEIEKKIWKRIWWTLFIRDRATGVAMGRPVMINLEDSDVPMISLEDFNEDEPGQPSPYGVNRVQALYFIYSVKLSEIMGLTIKEHYSIGAENIRRHNRVPDVSQCDMAMASWMNSLPQELRYSLKDRMNHDFFKAILHCQYYTVLCLVHRSNIIYQRKGFASGIANEEDRIPSYPSWGIAFQAAHMIVRIGENLDAFNELTSCPAFMIYTLFSAMILLIYQMESPSKPVVESAKRAVVSCRLLLEKLGKTWDTADRICKLANYLAADPRIREKVIRSAKRYADNQFFDDSQVDHHEAPHAPKRTYAEMARSDASNMMSNPLSGQEVPANQALGAVYPNYNRDQHQHSHDPHQSQREQQANGLPTHTVPSELFLVTGSTSPGPDVNSFQPSQLFPEILRRVDSENGSGASTGSQDPPMFTGFDSFGEQFGENASPGSDDALTTAAPNNLNLGDWYKFLMSNTGSTDQATTTAL